MSVVAWLEEKCCNWCFLTGSTSYEIRTHKELQKVEGRPSSWSAERRWLFVLGCESFVVVVVFILSLLSSGRGPGKHNGIFPQLVGRREVTWELVRGNLLSHYASGNVTRATMQPTVSWISQHRPASKAKQSFTFNGEREAAVSSNTWFTSLFGCLDKIRQAVSQLDRHDFPCGDNSCHVV